MIIFQHTPCEGNIALKKITIREEVSMPYLQTYRIVCKTNYTPARQKTQVKNGFKLRDCEDFSEVDSKIEPPHINKPATKLLGNLSRLLI